MLGGQIQEPSCLMARSRRPLPGGQIQWSLLCGQIQGPLSEGQVQGASFWRPDPGSPCGCLSARSTHLCLVVRPRGPCLAASFRGPIWRPGAASRGPLLGGKAQRGPCLAARSRGASGWWPGLGCSCLVTRCRSQGPLPDGLEAKCPPQPKPVPPLIYNPLGGRKTR